MSLQGINTFDGLTAALHTKQHRLVSYSCIEQHRIGTGVASQPHVSTTSINNHHTPIINIDEVCALSD